MHVLIFEYAWGHEHDQGWPQVFKLVGFSLAWLHCGLHHCPNGQEVAGLILVLAVSSSLHLSCLSKKLLTAYGLLMIVSFFALWNLIFFGWLLCNMISHQFDCIISQKTHKCQDHINFIVTTDPPPNNPTLHDQDCPVFSQKYGNLFLTQFGLVAHPFILFSHFCFSSFYLLKEERVQSDESSKL